MQKMIKITPWRPVASQFLTLNRFYATPSSASCNSVRGKLSFLDAKELLSRLDTPPAAPKKPANVYAIFLKDRASEILKSDTYAALSSKEKIINLAKTVAQEWRGLSESDKEVCFCI